MRTRFIGWNPAPREDAGTGSGVHAGKEGSAAGGRRLRRRSGVARGAAVQLVVELLEALAPIVGVARTPSAVVAAPAAPERAAKQTEDEEDEEEREEQTQESKTSEEWVVVVRGRDGGPPARGREALGDAELVRADAHDRGDDQGDERSEERRVGKEGRCRGQAEHEER